MDIGLLLLRLTVGLTLESSRGNEAFYKNNYRRVEIAGVGHLVHGNAPNPIAQLIREGIANRGESAQ